MNYKGASTSQMEKWSMLVGSKSEPKCGNANKTLDWEKHELMKEYAVTLSWVSQSHWTVWLRESIKNTDNKKKWRYLFSHDTGKENQDY